MARQFIPIFLCLLVLSLCALAAPIEKRGKKYKGQGTYYTPGLGSCGIESTAKDMIAALNAPQMGSSGNPNSNKNCGKKVKVKGPKGSVTVKIVSSKHSYDLVYRLLTLFWWNHRLIPVRDAPKVIWTSHQPLLHA